MVVAERALLRGPLRVRGHAAAVRWFQAALNRKYGAGAARKGKKLHDKREASAERDWQRDKARLMRDKG